MALLSRERFALVQPLCTLGRAPPRLQIALSSEDNRHKVGLFTVGGRHVNPLEAALQHLILGGGGGLSDETLFQRVAANALACLRIAE